MTAPRSLWLDWDYDRDNADTGTRSRYGNYLTQRRESFTELWGEDPSVEFAALAWRIATGPIMAPPLVRSHPRVVDVSLQRSGWNGEMTADVRLVSPRPQPLARATTADGGHFRDYPLTAWDRYDGIGEDDLARHAYLLTEVRLLWQLPVGTLPVLTQVPTSSDGLFGHAVACLEVLVGALTRELTPLIADLEQS